MVFRISNPVILLPKRKISVILHAQDKELPTLPSVSFWRDTGTMLRDDEIGAGINRELVVFIHIPSSYQGRFNLSVEFLFSVPEGSVVHGPFPIEVNPILHESIYRSKLPASGETFVEMIKLTNWSHEDRKIHVDVDIQKTGDPLDVSKISFLGTWVGDGKAGFLRPGQTQYLIFSFTLPRDVIGEVQGVSMIVKSTIVEKDATGEFR